MHQRSNSEVVLSKQKILSARDDLSVQSDNASSGSLIKDFYHRTSIEGDLIDFVSVQIQQQRGIKSQFKFATKTISSLTLKGLHQQNLKKDSKSVSCFMECAPEEDLDSKLSCLDSPQLTSAAECMSPNLDGGCIYDSALS